MALPLDTDCTTRVIWDDPCCTPFVVGVSVSQATLFEQAWTECKATLGQCTCVADLPFAENRVQALTTDGISVKCDVGFCMSYALPTP